MAWIHEVVESTYFVISLIGELESNHSGDHCRWRETAVASSLFRVLWHPQYPLVCRGPKVSVNAEIRGVASRRSGLPVAASAEKVVSGMTCF